MTLPPVAVHARRKEDQPAARRCERQRVPDRGGVVVLRTPRNLRAVAGGAEGFHGDEAGLLESGVHA